MKVYDVSSPIFTGMPVYKNKPEKQPKQTTNTNGYVTETRLELDVHTGTHVDAPLHMVVDGETIETLPLDKLVGPCKVFDLTSVEDRITVKDIEGLNIEKDDFLLFKTKNSFDEEFNFDFVFVAEDAAAYLAEIGVSGVGVDALGIERSQEGHPTHKTLFAGNVIIIEGLRLKDIAEGEYIMCAAPLKLSGVDASPARIVLMDMK
ncbi:cyclase [Bacillus sp. LL01]|uniref:cyclase family protein n=1 Tax=Bacillus sp. LL01 TaxID=1665556 RepID=UPI00064D2014|nr:cyclase family protein [Bacillus sp. LL01]KMJ59246.1 cyclase [Bacillus sp. LL01]